MVKRPTKALHPVDRAVGLNIRRARRLRGLTQEGLAEAIGLTFQQLQKYESGINRVSCSRLCDIAGALQVAPGDLLPKQDGSSGVAPPPVFGPLHRRLMAIFEHLTPSQTRVLVLMARAMVSGRSKA